MTKQELGLSKLIYKVKKDLLSEEALQLDPIPLFAIDEITVEVNFTVSGDITSGFDFAVVTLGSKVAEERIHKATIKMTPLLSKNQLTSKLVENHPDIVDQIASDSAKALIKGSLDGEAPSRE